jgi:hypothetical protein
MVRYNDLVYIQVLKLFLAKATHEIFFLSIMQIELFLEMKQKFSFVNKVKYKNVL